MQDIRRALQQQAPQASQCRQIPARRASQALTSIPADSSISPTGPVCANEMTHGSKRSRGNRVARR